MITPDEDEIVPSGENFENDAEDQKSQKDNHSDGVEREYGIDEHAEPDTEGLKVADKASEAAYTLDVDRDKPKGKK